jgi:hypothetical protein
MAKRHMACKSEDPLIKAESMAVDMRRSRKRDLIASKRELCRFQTLEEHPVHSMTGGGKEYPPIDE